MNSKVVSAEMTNGRLNLGNIEYIQWAEEECKWVYKDYGGGIDYWKPECSDNYLINIEKYNFCPYCGKPINNDSCTR
jgi:hypothetical protein